MSLSHSSGVSNLMTEFSDMMPNSPDTDWLSVSMQSFSESAIFEES